METITWAEYKARSVNKDGFRLTHYSPLFNNAFCMVNVEQKIGTVTHQIGWDARYFEKEWNNQVNQVADRHMSEYVEITAEVLEVIKSKLESYKKALKKASDWLATGLAGYDYNQAIHDKTFNAMMVEKYQMILSLCPSFECESQDEKTGDVMTKLLKKDSVPFLNVLYKLTDKRFSFNIVHSFNSGAKGYNLEMYFIGDFVASCSIPEFHITTAVDCLIDLLNYTDKQNHSDYFDRFGISFKLYHNKLNGKNYFSFRKNEGDKWVKISDKVAAYILEQNDIAINGLCDSVISYCQYDCYYNVNLKSE